MSDRTVFKTDDFELYQDKRGKFWLWNERDETNAAIRANSEMEAYQQAVGSLIFCVELQKEHRNAAENKLETLHRAFAECFPSAD